MNSIISSILSIQTEWVQTAFSFSARKFCFTCGVYWCVPRTCCPWPVSVTSHACTALSPVLPGSPCSRYLQECHSLIQEALPGHGMAGSVSLWKKACTETETNSLWLASIKVTATLVVTSFPQWGGRWGAELNTCTKLCAGHGRHVLGLADTRANSSPNIHTEHSFEFLTVGTNCKLKKCPKLTVSAGVQCPALSCECWI